MLHKVTSIDDLSCPFQLYILCVSAVFNMKTQLPEWKKNVVMFLLFLFLLFCGFGFFCLFGFFSFFLTHYFLKLQHAALFINYYYIYLCIKLSDVSNNFFFQ